MHPPRILGFPVVILSIVLALPVYSQEKNEPVGRTTQSLTTIEWPVQVDNDRVLLTVSGPRGFYYSKEFPAGKTPSFRVSDNSGRYVDGSYSYELRVVPRISSEVKRRLREARAAGDDQQIAQILIEAGLNDQIVQSGGFTIANGTFVFSTEPEPHQGSPSIMRLATTESGTAGASAIRLPPARALDFVIPDDVIVQGSACIGLDCVNGEVFGFDTIRMKENNIRVKFEDTSVGTFPTNDWQITANDSASGGQSKFSVEDITGTRIPFTIGAGAPTNSLFLASTGNLGLGTSVPGLDLHMNTSDTPAIRLEQNSGGGFTAQTWDVAGNEANFFVRDVTGGSRLSFRIRPGAPTSSIDINANGNVGIGTAAPTAKLHVFSSETTDANVTLGFHTVTGPALNIGYGGASLGRSGAFFNVRPDASAVAPNPSIRFMTGNLVGLIIDNEQFIGLGGVTNPTAPIEHVSGAKLTVAGQWQSVSSRGAKTDIRQLEPTDAIAALRTLQPVRFEYCVQPDDPQVGFIAEDVPEIVATPDRKTLNAMEIVALLTTVVKEQQKTIDELSERLGAIENKH